MIPLFVTEPDTEEGEIRTPDMPSWGIRTSLVVEARVAAPDGEEMLPEFITAVPTRTTLPEEEMEP